MAALTGDELRAVAYYGIGVSTEGGDTAYMTSFCGNTTRKSDGSIVLRPVGNSGYTIGEMQIDLGARPEVASALVGAFQRWAKNERTDWSLNEEQELRLASDLGRNGLHIRDPNYDSDNSKYKKEHAGRRIPDALLPEAGTDIDQSHKDRLNHYIATDAGTHFVHQQDVKQVRSLVDNLGGQLADTAVYKQATSEDQVRMVAVIAKSYNQGPAWTERHILAGIRDGKITSLDGISKAIDTYPGDPAHPDRPTYMQTGRDAALRGAEMFIALRGASERNPMHAAWQAVVANPLVDPSKLSADPDQPHLTHQYNTVKGLFVQPGQGRELVAALERGGSYNYGDPASERSRGFYAEGADFLQWDRNGRGRAYVAGQWLEISRSDLRLARHADQTLDIQLTQDGKTRSLLHVTHPSPARAAAKDAGASLQQGMHGAPVRDLQSRLAELGYMGNALAPDGKFGTVTRGAVQAFQRDHHLAEDGRAGAVTQQAIQADLRPLHKDYSGPLPAVSAMSALPASAPDLDDPRHAFNPHHALYAALKNRIPDASENRLLQFTAACNASQITADNLSTIHFDRSGGQMLFASSWPPGLPATVDLKAPSPQSAQSITQLQQVDQQHVDQQHVQPGAQFHVQQQLQQLQQPMH